jgi:hypothetical protein
MELGMVTQMTKKNATKVKPQLLTFELTFATQAPPKPKKKGRGYATGVRRRIGGAEESNAKKRRQLALAKGVKATALAWESERLLDAGESIVLAVARVNLLLAEIYEDAAKDIQVNGLDAQVGDDLDSVGEAEAKGLGGSSGGGGGGGGVLSRTAAERWVGHAKQVRLLSSRRSLLVACRSSHTSSLID